MQPTRVPTGAAPTRAAPGNSNRQATPPPQPSGSGTGGPPGSVNVAVGSNPTVGETAGSSTSLSDYEASISCDNTASSNNSGPLSVGTLQAGDQATCTITNKRKPQVKVLKALDPTSDQGKFNLKIDSQTYDNGGAGYGDGGNTRFVNVSTTSHTLSEAANFGTPTTLGDYDHSVR